MTLESLLIEHIPLALPLAISIEEAFTRIGRGCPHLQVLCVAESAHITSGCLTAIIKHCPRLRAIRGSCLGALSDSFLEVLGSNDPETIQDLDLSLCPRLSPDALEQTIPKLTSLRRLNLSWNPGVTDDVVELALESAPHLEMLSIQACPGVRGGAILHGVRQRLKLGHRDLRLNIASNPQISSDAVTTLKALLGRASVQAQIQ
ncbi:hypothetical protein HK105_200366 [Polyrhizophydium stewartii]|uniref:Uncharacterized protein n=1 Tax=Polyrhizophydium stewartii TaxID=2732419 RepID=A0ABR4NL85_9FUNG